MDRAFCAVLSVMRCRFLLLVLLPVDGRCELSFPCVSCCFRYIGDHIYTDAGGPAAVPSP